MRPWQRSALGIGVGFIALSATMHLAHYLVFGYWFVSDLGYISLRELQVRAGAGTIGIYVGATAAALIARRHPWWHVSPFVVLGIGRVLEPYLWPSYYWILAASTVVARIAAGISATYGLRRMSRSASAV